MRLPASGRAVVWGGAPRGFVALAGAVALVAFGAAQGVAPLVIVTSEARRSMAVSVVGGQEALALDDLAASFQLAVREEAGAITVSYRGRTIVLTPDQALASVSGRLVSLPAPVTRVGGRWFVPLEFVNRALASIHDTRLELRRPSRLLIVGDLRVPRLTIRYEPQVSGARLTVDATPAAAGTVTQEPGRLTIRFDADLLDVAVPVVLAQGLVQAIRVSDTTALAVELGPRFGGARTSTETVGNTARLIVDLAAVVTETSGPPAPAPPPAPSDQPVLGQTAASLRTIAVDPGHGGEDVGARGAQGAAEKDLTLAVARRLKSVIEARLGIRVLLTRDEDRLVPLDERTAVANNNKADLFLSLHANASPRPASAGASIYVASFDDEVPASRGPAERVPVFGGGLREIELVPWDRAQTRFVERSAALALILEEQFEGRIPLDQRATGRAPFRVLETANMPAVLIEMGYLTNPEQEKRLGSAEFQGAFVQAIFDAVLRFRAALNGSDGGER